MTKRIKVYAIPENGIEGYATGYRIAIERDGKFTKVCIIWQRRTGNVNLRYRYYTQLLPDFCLSINAKKNFYKFRLGGHNKISKMANNALLPILGKSFNTSISALLYDLTFKIIKVGLLRGFFTKPAPGQSIKIYDEYNGRTAGYVKSEDLTQ